MKAWRSYLALARKAFASNLHRPGFPFKLTFAITYWCNYKCKTCNIWQRKPKDELTADEIELFAQRSNRFSWIDVTGGEVSLRQDFPAICESLVKHNRDLVLLHFPTNGYLTDRIVGQVRQILKFRPPKLIITVSMDGDEQVNDEVRGVAGGYQRQIETFRQLRALQGVDVVLGMTLSKFNADQYENAFQAAKQRIPDLEYRDLHINVVHESSHYLGNHQDQHRQLDDRTLGLLIQETGRHAARRSRIPLHPVDFLEYAYLRRVEKYLRTGVTPMRCHALRSSCMIDSWGQVFPCTIYNRPLGSLREHNYELARIWQAEETRAVQREIWNKACPQCWTPCEAYPSIMGNFLKFGAPGPAQPPPRPSASIGDTPTNGTAPSDPPPHTHEEELVQLEPSRPS